MLEIRLGNHVRELARMRSELEALGARSDLSRRELDELTLVLEEVVANVVEHAFDDDAEHQIVVRVECTTAELQIEVEDDGRPFDPSGAPAPDLEVGLAQRRIGGLGVHLVRNLVDELEHQRLQGRNLLRLRKRRSRGPAAPPTSGSR